MKKLVLVMLFGLLLNGWVMAQCTGDPEPCGGVTNFAPTYDVMGAHENGGRGCAGCHAPHSGGRGSGGEIIIGSGASATGSGTAEGDFGLWGTDTNPIETGYANVIAFGGGAGAPYNTGSLSGLTWNSSPMYQGLVTCLSCHDGNMSKGAMMSGIAYEQAWGLLNFATKAGSNGNAAAVNLYGPNQIPSLLGNDGGTVGDYNNDHPCGPLANLGAVFGTYLSSALQIVTNAKSGKNSVTYINGTPYANFVSGYGMFAISSMAAPSDGLLTDYYITCTTCHNQHVQNVYSGTAGSTTGTFAKIFYVNGPYNPGAPYTPWFAPSTMRFCQQCHFSYSSEYAGSGTAVGTAF